MNKWIELLLGLVLLIAPIVLALSYATLWGIPALNLIKGGIIIGVALIGLMFVMLGISDISS